MPEDLFTRSRMLLGEEAMETLARARVAVFGLGGVGGACAEALCRAGVGALELIDRDTVSLTNLNRQLLATRDTLGLDKTEAAARRLGSINPDCRLTLRRTFFLPETAGDFDFTQYDYVVDAVDTVTAKLLLVERAKAAGTPIVCAMGAGNKLDPTAFRVADIAETTACPLARVMRKELKKRGITDVKVVYSTEPPVEIKRGKPGETRVKDVPGSVSFVPGVMGMIIAGEVVKDLMRSPGGRADRPLPDLAQQTI